MLNFGMQSLQILCLFENYVRMKKLIFYEHAKVTLYYLCLTIMKLTAASL